MALMTCRDLSLGYDSKAILSGINFSVNAGDYLCIVGENGSGKTTLMKTILSLQPPLSGEITIGDGLRKNDIGYLPQQTDVQRDFPASVTEIVLSGFTGKCGLRPFYNRAEKAAAKKILERLGISRLAKSCYRELSGGQQQRVLLARALCAAEKILLLDEPISGLDPEAAAEMYGLVKDLNKNEGLSIIMISHDIDAAIKYADHILHIGDTCFFGTTREYLRSAEGRRFVGSVGGGETRWK